MRLKLQLHRPEEFGHPTKRHGTSVTAAGACCRDVARRQVPVDRSPSTSSIRPPGEAKIDGPARYYSQVA
jgi:hypothetical protein